MQIIWWKKRWYKRKLKIFQYRYKITYLVFSNLIDRLKPGPQKIFRGQPIISVGQPIISVGQPILVQLKYNQPKHFVIVH